MSTLQTIIKKLILNKITAKVFLKPILNLHSFTYKLSGVLSSVLHDGMHPKHQIMKYKEWFVGNIQDDWVVLDVGCNTGMMPEIMSHKASFVYGVEIVEKHIEEANKKRIKDNILFICDDATTYDYSNCKAIDVVTLSNVLEHIEYRVEFLKKLITQVKWKDKKRFLIRVPMLDREWIAVYKKQVGLEYRLDRTHFTEYTFNEFKSELKLANIQILKYHIKFGEIYAVCEA
jgi:SAM-dependent methyltransferase